MTPTSHSWQLLIISLPSARATTRMRIWRNVKLLGCVALRDGVYLLPAQVKQVQQLQALADETLQAGGDALLLNVQAKDLAENQLFKNKFDRSPEYALWLTDLGIARKSLPTLSMSQLQKMQRKLSRSYDAIHQTDFFPGAASIQAETQWRDFVNMISVLQSPGEPQSKTGNVIPRDPIQYQGRTWATRCHLWVDRVASAWLIKRFIDPHATFIWLDNLADCPSEALGFDFDGATFSHVGELVSFEVLLGSFGLNHDRALVRLGAMVHALDIGGAQVPEASGFEAMLSGAKKRQLDDDQLLAEMSIVLDSLHAHFGN